VVVGADADVPALARRGRRPADPAEARRARPVGQRARVGDRAELLARERDREVAQPRELDALSLDREQRRVADAEAQEDRGAVGRAVGVGQRDGLGRGAVAADDDRPRRRVGQRGGEPGGVRAPFPGAVGQAAGEGDGVR
jgi:hypothetical protein